MIVYWVIVLIIAAFIYLILQTLGKLFFGMLSYNLTYDIRKLLYVNILTKNIGFFDHSENSTPVLSGVLQNDTSKINGVASDAIPPQVESLTLVFFGVAGSLYFCW